MASLFVFLAIAPGLSGALIPDAHAAWLADGVALSPNASNYKPVIVSDGGTGSLVAWYGGAGSDIHLRRINADGSSATGWPAADPVVVCRATGLQEQPVIVPDGQGGALLFWQDARNGASYDIYGQHIGSTGGIFAGAESNWIDDGIPVSTAGGNQYTPVAIPDGAGGAIVVWQDGRNGAGNYDIYAQRVDGNGNLLWAPAGVQVCGAANNQINPTMVSDGAGGAYIAWQDYRRGNEYDIYVQRITASGAVFSGWVANGLGVCVAGNSQFYPVLAPDGVGGVFVAWQDFRTGTENHIFAQRVSDRGAIVTGWPANGTPVCQAQYSQYYPVIANDGGTGVFLAWQDYRDGATNHVYAQRLTGGNQGWVTDGIAVVTAPNGQFSPQVSPDRQGGAFITWYDSRNGSTNDIFVHQVDANGVKNPNWDANGLGVCLADNTQQFPVITTIAAGSSVMTWQDLRAGGLTTAAIFAQQAGAPASTGVDPEPLPATIQLSAARPNPFQGRAEIRLTLPSRTSVRAEVLDVTGRRVSTLASGSLPAGVHALSWDGTNTRGERVAAGVYLVRVQWPGTTRLQRVVRLP